MAFQHWEIPGGQRGEGKDLQSAIEDAVGRAILGDNVQVSYLMSGRCYNLSVPEIDYELGLQVLSEHLAVLVSSVYASAAAKCLGACGRRIATCYLASYSADARGNCIPNDASFLDYRRTIWPHRRGGVPSSAPRGINAHAY